MDSFETLGTLCLSGIVSTVLTPGEDLPPHSGRYKKFTSTHAFFYDTGLHNFMLSAGFWCLEQKQHETLGRNARKNGVGVCGVLAPGAKTPQNPGFDWLIVALILAKSFI